MTTAVTVIIVEQLNPKPGFPCMKTRGLKMIHPLKIRHRLTHLTFTEDRNDDKRGFQLKRAHTVPFIPVVLNL